MVWGICSPKWVISRMGEQTWVLVLVALEFCWCCFVWQLFPRSFTRPIGGTNLGGGVAAMTKFSGGCILTSLGWVSGYGRSPGRVGSGKKLPHNRWGNFATKDCIRSDSSLCFKSLLNGVVSLYILLLAGRNLGALVSPTRNDHFC